MNPSVNHKEETTSAENPAERPGDGDGFTQAADKRGFVEPEISVPVDVLEATTFFQGLTSGVTNP